MGKRKGDASLREKSKKKKTIALIPSLFPLPPSPHKNGIFL